MSDPVLLHREYHGLPCPHDAQIPGPAKLMRLCTAKHPQGYNMGLAYPSNAPVFWIKYGSSIIWGEMAAQNLAHQELQGLRSPVRAPAVYYACELQVPCGTGLAQNFSYMSFIVMEYIPGKTAGDRLKDTDDPKAKDFVYSLMALALSELHRIPISGNTNPRSVDGGRIRYALFEDGEAPRHYKSIQQLEHHLNEFLTITKRQLRVKDLEREPIVFCYSDVWLDNFIIDDEGHVVVVDFAEASLLPSSFSKAVLLSEVDKIGRDISALVEIPTSDGIDNASALLAAHGPMVMGWSSFVSVGQRLFGEDSKKDNARMYQPLIDEEGIPVTIPRQEPDQLPPSGVSKGSPLPPFWLAHTESDRN